ncbi:sulfatase family protein [Thalassotalea sp. PLHSN55]|uniref:sulfatase family protein n=1 Tax=Thalassotalea sp. PLHSN55 TaxID=3435888 RepID=UPI003F8553CE
MFNKKNHVGKSVKFTLNLLGALICVCCSVSAAEPTQKPNFVWLLSEDNSKDFLRLYNPKGAAMPHVEQLAKNGLIFEHAFSNAPVCSTARSTLATGSYAPRLGLNFHRPQALVNLPDNLKAISQYLKNAGYYTSNDAKEDYNFHQPKGGVWHASKKGAHWRNRDTGQPFFHMQTWQNTHESRLHFPLEDLTNAPTQYAPENVDLFPLYPDTKLFRYTHARYLDLHTQVDQQIGKVIEQLKADGELENTFVFYFGDHGGVLPASKGYPYERGLNVPLVVRIPENYRHLLHPDMQQLRNMRLNGFVNFVDFAPTLLKLAGIASAKQHDGQAFMGHDVSLPALENRNFAFGYADRFDEKSDMVRTIRRGKFKYIRHFEPFNPDALFNQYRFKQQAYKEWKQLNQAKKLTNQQAAFFKTKPPEALYDLESDPFEMNNLGANSSYKARLLSMRSELAQHLKALPDLSFYSEGFLADNAFADPVSFSQEHHSEIAQLIDIANLQLLPYKQAKDQLSKALTASSSWQRYWALTGLVYFGKQALEFNQTVRKIMQSDTSALNQARAIQFLAMTEQLDPRIPLQTLIARTENDIDALAILNIAAQLHDVKGHQFDIAMKASWQQPNSKMKNTKMAIQQKRKYAWFNARSTYLAN